MEIVRNIEKQGIELYFNSKPEQKIIDTLKNAKFRWHNVKKCWYVKESPAILEIVKNIQEGKIEIVTKEKEKLKSLRIATEEEKRRLASILWEKEDMINYICSTYDYYITNDNCFIEIQKANKLSIHKTMWYDDETEEPEENENNFILYNMRSNNPARMLEDYLKEKEHLEKHGSASGRYDYNGIYFVKARDKGNVVDYNFTEEKRNFVRYLTKEEEQDLINIMIENKEKYLDRLKKYYKRYSEYVRVSGYWVNR